MEIFDVMDDFFIMMFCIFNKLYVEEILLLGWGYGGLRVKKLEINLFSEKFIISGSDINGIGIRGIVLFN